MFVVLENSSEDEEQEIITADCPNFKSLELTIGSPRRPNGGGIDAVGTMDDNGHLGLQKMLNNFYKYKITNNITFLYINNDDQLTSLKKFNVLLNCVIDHNSEYFPSLKKLQFCRKCDAIVDYLAKNKKCLICFTKIDTIGFDFFRTKRDCKFVRPFSELKMRRQK